MALSMHQVPAALGMRHPGMGSLGYAQIVSAIVGPLATSGADIFRTSQESKISKRELKQRRREFEAQERLARETLEAQERSQIVSQHAALQRSAASQAWWARNTPLVAGVVALTVLAIAVASLGKK